MSIYRRLNEQLNKLLHGDKLNEGMWESPFLKSHVPAIKKLFSDVITTKDLVNNERYTYWNVIGDDSFWDEVEELAEKEPTMDARIIVANYLEEWMKNKDTFVQGAYDEEAADEISNIIKTFKEQTK